MAKLRFSTGGASFFFDLTDDWFLGDFEREANGDF